MRPGALYSESRRGLSEACGLSSYSSSLEPVEEISEEEVVIEEEVVTEPKAISASSRARLAASLRAVASEPSQG